MRQQLLDLFEVQKIDQLIRDVEKIRDAAPAKLKELEARVGGLQGDIDGINAERDQLTTQIKTLEGTVQAETLKLRKWEKRLSEIRNQREYLALSREVEGSKRANRDTEEQIIELMGQREALDAKIDELQDNLAENGVDAESEREDVKKELSDLETKVAEHLAVREELIPKIPARLLKRYDSIRKKRLGVGLVAASDGSCNGCNMRLPPQLFNILQRGDTIEQCPSCQRILIFQGFLEDDGAPTEQSEGAEASP